MDTLLIHLTNTKAYKLLQDLEELNLIKIVKEPSKISALRGKIKLKQTDAQINEQLQSIREEWQRNI